MFETNNNNIHSLSSSNQNKAAKSSTTKTMTANRNNNNHPDKKKRAFTRNSSSSNLSMQLLSRLATCSNAPSRRHHHSKPLMTITILTTSTILVFAAIFLLLSNGLITQQVDGAAVNSVGKYKSQRDRGCFYMMKHFKNGEPIKTEEPCLNCTCENSMLMCYLRVCPYVKPIGDRCIIERVPGECCPKITCPNELPSGNSTANGANVEQDFEQETLPASPESSFSDQLLNNSTLSSSPNNNVTSQEIVNWDGSSSSTTASSVSGSTATAATALGVSSPNNGCMLDGQFYHEGAQMPSDKSKPCEVCYCIKNSAACVMQDCALEVGGCTPIYAHGGCCPTRYNCSSLNSARPKSSSSASTTRFWDRFTLGGSSTSTSTSTTTSTTTTTTPKPPINYPDFGRASQTPLEQNQNGGRSSTCRVANSSRVYANGARVPTKNKCEHCYCMKGEVVCSVQKCEPPCEGCTPIIDPSDQCCPKRYECFAPTQRVPVENLTFLNESELFDSTTTPIPLPPSPPSSSPSTIIEDISKPDVASRQPDLSSSTPTATPEPESSSSSTSLASVNTGSMMAQNDLTTTAASSSPSMSTLDSSSTTAPSAGMDAYNVLNEKNQVPSEVSIMTTRQTKPPPMNPKSPKVNLNEDEQPGEVISGGEQNKSLATPAAAPTTTTHVDGFNLHGEREREMSNDNQKSSGKVFANEGSQLTNPSGPNEPPLISMDPSLTSTPPSLTNGDQSITAATGSSSEATSVPEERQPAIIPGEGSCRYNGRVYQNGEEVKPKDNKCMELCMCVSGVVYCDEVDCPKPPDSSRNCKRIQVNGECCPKYVCDEEAASSSSSTTTTPEPISSSTAAQPAAPVTTTVSPAEQTYSSQSPSIGELPESSEPAKITPTSVKVESEPIITQSSTSAPETITLTPVRSTSAEPVQNVDVSKGTEAESHPAQTTTQQTPTVAAESANVSPNVIPDDKSTTSNEINTSSSAPSLDATVSSTNAPEVVPPAVTTTTPITIAPNNLDSQGTAQTTTAPSESSSTQSPVVNQPPVSLTQVESEPVKNTESVRVGLKPSEVPSEQPTVTMTTSSPVVTPETLLTTNQLNSQPINPDNLMKENPPPGEQLQTTTGQNATTSAPGTDNSSSSSTAPELITTTVPVVASSSESPVQPPQTPTLDLNTNVVPDESRTSIGPIATDSPTATSPMPAVVDDTTPSKPIEANPTTLATPVEPMPITTSAPISNVETTSQTTVANEVTSTQAGIEKLAETSPSPTSSTDMEQTPKVTENQNVVTEEPFPKSTIQPAEQNVPVITTVAAAVDPTSPTAVTPSESSSPTIVGGDSATAIVPSEGPSSQAPKSDVTTTIAADTTQPSRHAPASEQPPASDTAPKVEPTNAPEAVPVPTTTTEVSTTAPADITTSSISSTAAPIIPELEKVEPNKPATESQSAIVTTLPESSLSLSTVSPNVIDDKPISTESMSTTTPAAPFPDLTSSTSSVSVEVPMTTTASLTNNSPHESAATTTAMPLSSPSILTSEPATTSTMSEVNQPQTSTQAEPEQPRSTESVSLPTETKATSNEIPSSEVPSATTTASAPTATSQTLMTTNQLISQPTNPDNLMRESPATNVADANETTPLVVEQTQTTTPTVQSSQSSSTSPTIIPTTQISLSPSSSSPEQLTTIAPVLTVSSEAPSTDSAVRLDSTRTEAAPSDLQTVAKSGESSATPTESDSTNEAGSPATASSTSAPIVPDLSVASPTTTASPSTNDIPDSQPSSEKPSSQTDAVPVPTTVTPQDTDVTANEREDKQRSTLQEVLMRGTTQLNAAPMTTTIRPETENVSSTTAANPPIVESGPASEQPQVTSSSSQAPIATEPVAPVEVAQPKSSEQPTSETISPTSKTTESPVVTPEVVAATESSQPNNPNNIPAESTANVEPKNPETVPTTTTTSASSSSLPEITTVTPNLIDEKPINTEANSSSPQPEVVTSPVVYETPITTMRSEPIQTTTPMVVTISPNESILNPSTQSPETTQPAQAETESPKSSESVPVESNKAPTNEVATEAPSYITTTSVPAVTSETLMTTNQLISQPTNPDNLIKDNVATSVVEPTQTTPIVEQPQTTGAISNNLTTNAPGTENQPSSSRAPEVTTTTGSITVNTSDSSAQPAQATNVDLNTNVVPDESRTSIGPIATDSPTATSPMPAVVDDTTPSKPIEANPTTLATPVEPMPITTSAPISNVETTSQTTVANEVTSTQAGIEKLAETSPSPTSSTDMEQTPKVTENQNVVTEEPFPKSTIQPAEQNVPVITTVAAAVDPTSPTAVTPSESSSPTIVDGDLRATTSPNNPAQPPDSAMTSILPEVSQPQTEPSQSTSDKNSDFTASSSPEPIAAPTSKAPSTQSPGQSSPVQPEVSSSNNKIEQPGIPMTRTSTTWEASSTPNTPIESTTSAPVVVSTDAAPVTQTPIQAEASTKSSVTLMPNDKSTSANAKSSQDETLIPIISTSDSGSTENPIGNEDVAAGSSTVSPLDSSATSSTTLAPLVTELITTVSTTSPADEFVTGISASTLGNFEPVNVTTTIPSIRGSATPITIPWSDIANSTSAPITTTTTTTTTTEPPTSQSSISPLDGAVPVQANATSAAPSESASSSTSPDSDYESSSEEQGCEYEGKTYNSAQQIHRSNPCDFCFCFRGDIICLQQTCPPPVANCFETVMEGFCCPRYECPVHTVRMGANSTSLTVAPFERNASNNSTQGVNSRSQNDQSNNSRGSVRGCFVDNKLYGVGERILGASGPCMDCLCDKTGMMKCSPKECAPEDPLLQQINNEVLASTLARSQARR